MDFVVVFFKRFKSGAFEDRPLMLVPERVPIMAEEEEAFLGVNKDHFVEVREWQAMVDGDPILKPVGGGHLPLTRLQGAMHQQYDADDFVQHMKSKMDYVVAGCLDWASPTCGPSAGVAINGRRLKRHAEQRFPKGLAPECGHVEGLEVVVIVQDASYDPKSHLGSLPRSSSCEELHEVWYAMAQSTKVEDTENKRRWAKIRRNVTFRFQLQPASVVSDAASATSQHNLLILNCNQRERKNRDAARVRWGPIQRVQFVRRMKTLLAAHDSKPIEKITVNMVKAYLSKITAHEDSEPFNDRFLAEANVVGQKMIHLASAVETLLQFDDGRPAKDPKDSVAAVDGDEKKRGDPEMLYETIFDSVTQLLFICQVAKTDDLILHSLKQMLVQYQAHLIHKEAFSQRNIKITVEIMLLQKQGVDWLARWMSKHEWPDDQVTLIKDKLADWDKAHVHFKQNLAWQARLWPSALKVAFLGHSFAHTNEHRTKLSNKLNWGSTTIQEVFEMETLKKSLDEILETLETEKVKAKSATGQSAGLGNDQLPDSGESVRKIVISVTTMGEQTEKDLVEQKKRLVGDAADLVERTVDAWARRYVSLKVYPADLGEMPEMVREDDHANVLGSDGDHVILHWDRKCWTEAASQPATRPSPCPRALREKVITGLIVGRSRHCSGEEPSLNAHEFVVVQDGNCSNPKPLLSPWLKGGYVLNSFLDVNNITPAKKKKVDDDDDRGVDEPKQSIAVENDDEAVLKMDHKEITATFKETSVRARRKMVKQPLSLPQKETWHILSVSGGTKLPYVECSEFAGQSNEGTLVGEITLLPYEQEWQLDVLAKRVVYGDWRIAVGGKNPITDMERKPTDIEPVFFQSVPPSCMRVLKTRLMASAVVSLSPGVGHDAAVCAVDKSTYFGFCMSEAHKRHIWSHCKVQILKSLIDPKHVNHDPAVAKAYNTSRKKTEEDDAKTKAAAEAKAEAKKAAEGKKAAAEAKKAEAKVKAEAKKAAAEAKKEAKKDKNPFAKKDKKGKKKKKDDQKDMAEPKPKKHKEAEEAEPEISDIDVDGSGSSWGTSSSDDSTSE